MIHITIIEGGNNTKHIETKRRNSILVVLKMLGEGFFLIALVGILSFILLFFILWFM